MSLRWRLSGEILCGAKSDPVDGDTYLDDNLHYQLAVILKVLIPDKDEKNNGLWYWIDPNKKTTFVA